jgi:transcriptional regulator with XRE-family HTH domain
MKVFATNVRRRIAELALSHADVARRAGLDARRFGHYVTGLREPDFQTLLRIAKVLGTTPDALLGVGDPIGQLSDDQKARQQISAACEALAGPVLQVLLVQVSALAVATRDDDGPKGKGRRRN